MPAFMEEYEKQHLEVVCIPGIEMNRPYVPGATIPGDVGLELEIEGNNLPTQGSLEKISGKTSGARWLAKTDGSLRGEALEYVLSAPCNIDEAEPMIVGLYDKFKTLGTALQLTNRCSTHVHVNMTGKKVNEITSAIALWTAFEEPLTLWAGEERVNNHFCLSAKDSNFGTVSAWRSFLRSGSARFGDNLKYSALNILTLQRFGSIEYRVMNASEDPARLVDWTKFIFTMTRYAGEQFNNPRTLLYAMSERGGQELFRDICDRAGVSRAFVLGVEETVPDIGRSVLEGFRRAQPLVAGFDWDSWMPEINKEYVANPFGSKKKGKGPMYADFADFDVAVAAPEPGRAGLALNRIRPRGDRIIVDDALAGAFDAFRNIPPAPAAPPPQPTPERRERPDFVPEGFTFDELSRVWVRDNYATFERILNRYVDNSPAHTLADFRDVPQTPVDWSRDIMWAGTNIPAYVMKISRDGSQALVRASTKIECAGSRTVEPHNRTGYWYDQLTGMFVGGLRGYPVVSNR